MKAKNVKTSVKQSKSAKTNLGELEMYISGQAPHIVTPTSIFFPEMTIQFPKGTTFKGKSPKDKIVLNKPMKGTIKNVTLDI